jgi:hypothetical protein
LLYRTHLGIPFQLTGLNMLNNISIYKISNLI